MDTWLLTSLLEKELRASAHPPMAAKCKMQFSVIETGKGGAGRRSTDKKYVKKRTTDGKAPEIFAPLRNTKYKTFEM